MKNFSILLLVLIIYNFSLNIDECKCQWAFQYNAGNYVLLNKIQFANDNTGYVIGELDVSPSSVFLKTTNGGNNWINMNISLSFETWLYDLCFLNENTGFICGYSVNIYKTTNGGVNWNTIPVPYFGNQTWNAIQFFDENTGYIAGRYGMREKTTNGGVNWILMDTTFRNIYDIYFFNPNTGFMADGQGYVQKTTNGGINWVTSLLIDTLGSGYSLQKIDFSNNNTGYVVGLNTVTGAVFKTTDGGNFWKNILITPNGLRSLQVVNNSTLYSGGASNKVIYSTNSGVSWNYQILPTAKGGIFSIYFTNNLTGYLCIDNDIYKTTNGGVNILKISSEVPNDFKLFQNYPNPFNSYTKIKFEIPLDVKHKTLNINLMIYDILGKEIATLVNEPLHPGTYEVTFNGSNLSSGVYFYRIEAGDFTSVKKMLMIK